jgi:triacylglycerol lipase
MGRVRVAMLVVPLCLSSLLAPPLALANGGGSASPAGPAIKPATGPDLTVPVATLASALSCPATFNHAHEPVLLVHGTPQTPGEAWSWNYGRVLPPQGFDVCTVALPDLARGDIQVQTEYVVYAITAMAQRSGSKVDVVAFSVSPLAARAAMKWWPAARSVTDDLVMLEAPNHGTVNVDVFCALPCIPVFWQIRPASVFLAALNAGDETPGDVSYTSVYSWTDPAIQPNLPGSATSNLVGASNIAVQDLCLGRLVDHVGALSDAVVYAAVLDALIHPGPADPARIDRAVCTQLVMPGVEPLLAVTMSLAWYPDITVGALEHQTDREPALAPWAVP